MNLRFKINSVVALALTAAFGEFFMFAKHEAALAAMIPFGDDPYDSVGSFCMIVSFLLSVLCLFRAFRPYRDGGATAMQKVFLARAQMAIAIGVLATLAGDWIAMARHGAVWMGKAATGELLVPMAGMAAVSVGALVLFRRPSRGVELALVERPWRRAVLVAVLFVLVLAFFPEEIIPFVFPHFLAIVLGFVLVAAAQAAFSVALLPFETRETVVYAKRRLSGWMQWGGIALIGLAIGTAILMQEIYLEGAGNAPLRQVLVLSAVCLGAGTAALLVAFGFLRKPLGLFRRA